MPLMPPEAGPVGKPRRAAGGDLVLKALKIAAFRRTVVSFLLLLLFCAFRRFVTDTENSAE